MGWRRRLFHFPAPDGWTPAKGERVLIPEVGPGYSRIDGIVIAVVGKFAKVGIGRGTTMYEVSELRPENFASMVPIEVRDDPPPVGKVPLSQWDLDAIKALAGVTYTPGSYHKRFAHNVQGSLELTEKQRALAWSMVWRYRRQIPNKRLVSIADERRQEVAPAGEPRAGEG